MEEWKIGDVKQVNGEWYLCVEGNGCENCAFNGRKCYLEGDTNDPIGECCCDRRRDNKDVIFKKLEKVGEPFEFEDALIQELKLIDPKYVCDNCFFINKCASTSLGLRCRTNTSFFVLIKQNQKDMEEKRNRT